MLLLVMYLALLVCTEIKNLLQTVGFLTRVLSFLTVGTSSLTARFSDAF